MVDINSGLDPAKGVKAWMDERLLIGFYWHDKVLYRISEACSTSKNIVRHIPTELYADYCRYMDGLHHPTVAQSSFNMLWAHQAKAKGLWKRKTNMGARWMGFDYRAGFDRCGNVQKSASRPIPHSVAAVCAYWLTHYVLTPASPDYDPRGQTDYQRSEIYPFYHSFCRLTGRRAYKRARFEREWNMWVYDRGIVQGWKEDEGCEGVLYDTGINIVQIGLDL